MVGFLQKTVTPVASLLPKQHYFVGIIPKQHGSAKGGGFVSQPTFPETEKVSSGEACPFVPGLQRLDWPLEDPKVSSQMDLDALCPRTSAAQLWLEAEVCCSYSICNASFSAGRPYGVAVYGHGEHSGAEVVCVPLQLGKISRQGETDPRRSEGKDLGAHQGEGLGKGRDLITCVRCNGVKERKITPICLVLGACTLCQLM